MADFYQQRKLDEGFHHQLEEQHRNLAQNNDLNSRLLTDLMKAMKGATAPMKKVIAKYQKEIEAAAKHHMEQLPQIEADLQAGLDRFAPDQEKATKGDD